MCRLSEICQRTVPDSAGFGVTQRHECQAKTASDQDKHGLDRTSEDQLPICSSPPSDMAGRRECSHGRYGGTAEGPLDAILIRSSGYSTSLHTLGADRQEIVTLTLAQQVT